MPSFLAARTPTRRRLIAGNREEMFPDDLIPLIAASPVETSLDNDLPGNVPKRVVWRTCLQRNRGQVRYGRYLS